ncbi:MAG TPA: hypothetical protein VHF69_09735 [Candidatus Synoicihabitans sp.]|nr:hypothetical protein [Candidatus Synoicihabitans sp.]
MKTTKPGQSAPVRSSPRSPGSSDVPNGSTELPEDQPTQVDPKLGKLRPEEKARRFPGPGVTGLDSGASS